MRIPEIFWIFLKALFFGFVVWTFIWVFIKGKALVVGDPELVDRFAVSIMSGLGLLALLFTVGSFIKFDLPLRLDVDSALVERAVGQYWYGYWIYPFTYIGLVQLLRFQVIRSSRVTRALFALWIFGVMHIDRFVILVTSMHRDYTTVFPSYLVTQTVIEWMFGIALFVVVVFGGLKIRNAIAR